VRNYYLQFEAQQLGLPPPGMMMHPGMHPGMMHPGHHPGMMMPPGGMPPHFQQRYPLDASQGMRPLGAPPPGAPLLRCALGSQRTLTRGMLLA
jgi:hypothetical protein